MLPLERDPSFTRVGSVLALFATAVGVLALAATAQASSQMWKWSKGYKLHGASASAVVAGLSCPSTKLCLATVGDIHGRGGVFWSTKPTAGASSWHFDQFAAPITGAPGALACDSTKFCAIAGPDYWDTGDPTSKSEWNLSTTAALGDSYGLGAVSCWVNIQCAVLDEGGGVLTIKGAEVISGPTTIFGTQSSVNGISCAPHVNGKNPFCAAVDDTTPTSGRGGDVAWTTDPTSGDWQTANIKGGSSLENIDCPSDGFCVAIEGGNGGLGYVGVAKSGSQGSGWAGAWKAFKLPSEENATVETCRSASFCAVSGATLFAHRNGNFVYTSTRPSASKSAWHRSTLNDGSSTDLGTAAAGMSCPSAKECFVISGDGEISVGRLK